MLPAVGGWRLSLLRAAAVFYNSSAAACEAVVVISQCNEVFLKSALALTDSVSCYLAALLRLNALLRVTLAGGLFSREQLEQRRRSSCSTRKSSRSFGENSCTPLCWGEGTCVERVQSVQSVQSVLHAAPTLCRGARSVCAAMLTLVHVVVSLLGGNVRSTVSTFVTCCGCIRPVVFTLLTVCGYWTQLLHLGSL